MSRTSGPEGYEIGALRKRQVEQWNPMAPGVGTPWEDRATHGTVGAFLKTCVASMTRPRKLADGIRRPETNTDVKPFVYGCAACWGVSAGYHVAWALWHKAHSPPPPKFDLDEVSNLWVGIDIVVSLAGAAVGVVLLWMMFTAIYNRLVQQEARPVKLTEPLIANVTGYAFGPSLLALIPIAGPPLSLLVMLIVLVVIGTCSRVRLRFSAAVIDALLSFLAMVAVGVAGAAVLWVSSDNVIPSGVPTVPKTVNEANQPAIRPQR